MQGLGMILFLLFFGIVSAGIWISFNWKHTEYNRIIYSLKSVLFFFAGLYFIVSVLKYYLGEAESTLPESFWDVVGRTYLHYGIVFAAVSFLVPWLMKRWFLVYGYHFVQIFDFIYVIAIVMDLLWIGRIENRNYCIIYVICMLTAGLGLFYKLNYTNKKIRSRGVRASAN